MIISNTILSTNYGELAVNYHQFDDRFCITIVNPVYDITLGEPIVRLHSSCLFSEALRSTDCDCNLQLGGAMELISKKPGVIVYLYQEGRGHGLAKKIESMEVERKLGLDTYDAFRHLGLELDPRDYTVALNALNDLKLSKDIRLISNNPRKRKALEDAGYHVLESIKLKYEINPKVRDYLNVKKHKLGHEINYI